MANEILNTLEEDEFRATIATDLNVDAILKLPLKCTICSEDMVHQLVTPQNVHPYLGVLICDDCNEMYESEMSNRPKTIQSVYPGRSFQCQWCACTLTNCSNLRVSCKFCKPAPTFCKDCITEHAPETLGKDFQTYNSWTCFACDSQPIWSLRALCELVLKIATMETNETGEDGEEIETVEIDEADKDGEEMGTVETNESDEVEEQIETVETNDSDEVEKEIETNSITLRKEIKQKVRKSDESKDCVVCMDGEALIAFYPCGHQAVCEDCVMQYKKTYGSCPTCRKLYKDTLRIY